MRGLKQRKKVEKPLEEYTPIGQAFCEAKCDRRMIQTKEGMVVVCDGCNRVVMDMRD